MADGLLIDRRFCGPAGYGHGGYLAGLLGARLGYPVEVRLRKPVPLECALETRYEDSVLEVLDQDGIVARAARAHLMVIPPVPVTRDEAAWASGRSPLLAHHPFPDYFACGTGRRQGDGLRVFPGALCNARAFAALWAPAPAESGIPPEFAAAALDCTSGVAAIHSPPGFGDTAWVTGRIALDLRWWAASPGPYCVVGWREQADARKLVGAAALTGAGGQVAGLARTSWYRAR